MRNSEDTWQSGTLLEAKGLTVYGRKYMLREFRDTGRLTLLLRSDGSRRW